MPELNRFAVDLDADGFPPSRASWLSDFVIIVGWFAALGVVSALVWWQVTPLAAYTRTKDNAVMGELELGVSIATDGWYAAIGFAAGLLSGLVLMRWRRRDAMVTVLLLIGGSALAALLMYAVGGMLGPDQPTPQLVSQTPIGGKVYLPLRPESVLVGLVWPLGSLAGALVWLLGTSEDGQPANRYQQKSRFGQDY